MNLDNAEEIKAFVQRNAFNNPESKELWREISRKYFVEANIAIWKEDREIE